MTASPDYSDDVPMAWVSKEPEVVARRLDHPELQRDAAIALWAHKDSCATCFRGGRCTDAVKLADVGVFFAERILDEIKKAEAREAAKNAKRPT
jgi:hypothetical protein